MKRKVYLIKANEYQNIGPLGALQQLATKGSVKIAVNMFIFLMTMFAEQNEIGDESYTQGRRQDLDGFIVSCMW